MVDGNQGSELGIRPGAKVACGTGMKIQDGYDRGAVILHSALRRTRILVESGRGDFRSLGDLFVGGFMLPPYFFLFSCWRWLILLGKKL